MFPKNFEIPIFIYEDYVDFLKAWYAYSRRFGVTQKVLMGKAGIKAQAYFSDILSQRKKIGKGRIQGFIDALELAPDEAEYFSLLVNKKNARDPRAKELVCRRLASLREKKITAIFSGCGTPEYFSSWKYPVIREYINAQGFVRSPTEICRSFMNLKLGLTETKRVLHKLIKWNMVEYDEKSGGYRPNNRQLVTYSEMPHAVVKDVKRSLIESSIHAMENLDADERSVSMAIRGIGREAYNKFCMKIDELRKEFLEADNCAEHSDHVYALTVQLFPVMKINRGSNDETRRQ